MELKNTFGAPTCEVNYTCRPLLCFNHAIPNLWMPSWSLFLFSLHATYLYIYIYTHILYIFFITHLAELQLLKKQIRLHCCTSEEKVILHTLQGICESRCQGISMIAVSPIQSVSKER